MTVLPTYCRQGEWREWYADNAMSLSSHCRARGRYELASDLHDIGTEWYEKEVVLKRQPGDTADDRKTYRQVLADYKAERPEFGLLVATRKRLLDALSKYPSGIDRNALKKEIGHQGSTTFGTICNQLERGGWLRQQKDGKKYKLLPAAATVVSDEAFASAEIPTPAELRKRADTTPPIASVTLSATPKGQKGCVAVLGVAAFLIAIASGVVTHLL
jgi:hypothetical protein